MASPWVFRAGFTASPTAFVGKAEVVWNSGILVAKNSATPRLSVNALRQPANALITVPSTGLGKVLVALVAWLPEFASTTQTSVKYGPVGSEVTMTRQSVDRHAGTNAAPNISAWVLRNPPAAASQLLCTESNTVWSLGAILFLVNLANETDEIDLDAFFLSETSGTAADASINTRVNDAVLHFCCGQGNDLHVPTTAEASVAWTGATQIGPTITPGGSVTTDMTCIAAFKNITAALTPESIITNFGVGDGRMALTVRIAPATSPPTETPAEPDPDPVIPTPGGVYDERLPNEGRWLGCDITSVTFGNFRYPSGTLSGISGKVGYGCLFFEAEVTGDIVECGFQLKSNAGDTRYDYRTAATYYSDNNLTKPTKLSEESEGYSLTYGGTVRIGIWPIGTDGLPKINEWVGGSTNYKDVAGERQRHIDQGRDVWWRYHSLPAGAPVTRGNMYCLVGSQVKPADGCASMNFANTHRHPEIGFGPIRGFKEKAMIYDKTSWRTLWSGCPMYWLKYKKAGVIIPKGNTFGGSKYSATSGNEDNVPIKDAKQVRVSITPPTRPGGNYWDCKKFGAHLVRINGTNAGNLTFKLIDSTDDSVKATKTIPVSSIPYDTTGFRVPGTHGVKDESDISIEWTFANWTSTVRLAENRKYYVIISGPNTCEIHIGTAQDIAVGYPPDSDRNLGNKTDSGNLTFRRTNTGNNTTPSWFSHEPSNGGGGDRHMCSFLLGF